MLPGHAERMTITGVEFYRQLTVCMQRMKRLNSNLRRGDIAYDTQEFEVVRDQLGGPDHLVALAPIIHDRCSHRFACRIMPFDFIY